LIIIYDLSIKKESKARRHNQFYTLYFSSSLSLSNTSKAMFKLIKRSHKAIRDCWIQKYKPSKRLFYKETGIAKYIIDETQIKFGSECIWL
jgi:hypothetical protein